GTVILTHLDEDGWHDLLFSTRHACLSCDLSFDELAPRSFSFNSPYGACPACGGLGVRFELDPDLVVPDRRLSLAAGAIQPARLLRGTRRGELRGLLETFARSHRVKLDQPVAEFSRATMRALIDGDEEFPGLLSLLGAALQDAEDERLRA